MHVAVSPPTPRRPPHHAHHSATAPAYAAGRYHYHWYFISIVSTEEAIYGIEFCFRAISHWRKQFRHESLPASTSRAQLRDIASRATRYRRDAFSLMSSSGDRFRQVYFAAEYIASPRFRDNMRFMPYQPPARRSPRANRSALDCCASPDVAQSGPGNISVSPAGFSPDSEFGRKSGYRMQCFSN